MLTPTYLFIFIAGFLAVSAMFLPGISGAFILLVLGLYEFMIDSIHSFRIDNIFIFLLGAILGAFVISRFIDLFFRIDKSKTLYVLLGLVIGTLAIPIKQIIETGFGNVYIVIFLAMIGGSFGLWLTKR